MNGGVDLLAAVRTLLGPVGGGPTDVVDPVEAAARVAWSAVVEPGDAVAGALVQGLGAERALASVRAAEDDGPLALVEECADVGVPGAEDPGRSSAPWARRSSGGGRGWPAATCPRSSRPP